MRILVVDDERAVREALERALRLEGYEVELAVDGQQALMSIAGHTVDAIVLDILMPVMDGIETCTALRRMGNRTPVLMLTARHAIDDRVAGLDAGADDYLVKPFELDELYARLRALLRRMPALLPTTLAIDDLIIDTRGQDVARGGRRIPLTTKEYVMLEYLARNAGRVIGRAELCEHVWDANHDPFSNAIEVYINRLRKKVDDAGGTPLIHTRRGAGYLLSAEGGERGASVAAGRPTPPRPGDEDRAE
jgi:DNA-binding response OmpR family regulator